MNTQKFEACTRSANVEAKEMLESVYEALKKKGYNPMTQIVGYILSGDPTYITSYDNARATIGKLERDELLEELVRDFLRDVI